MRTSRRDCRADHQDVGRVSGGGWWDGRWVSYLDDARACTGCDDRGGGADVECVVSVSAGSDDVDDKVLVVVFDCGFESPGAEHCGSS